MKTLKQKERGKKGRRIKIIKISNRISYINNFIIDNNIYIYIKHKIQMKMHASLTKFIHNTCYSYFFRIDSKIKIKLYLRSIMLQKDQQTSYYQLKYVQETYIQKLSQ